MKIYSVLVAGGLLFAAPAVVRAGDLVVSPTLSTVYDTNALHGNGRQGSPSQDEFQVTPGLAASWNNNIGLGNVSASLAAGYDWHSRYKFLNRPRISGDLSGNFRMTRACSIDPKAEISYSQRNLSDLGVSVSDAAIEQTYQAKLNCDGVSGFFPTASANYSTSRNSAVASRVYNRNSASGMAGIVYVQPSVGRFQLYGVYETSSRPVLTVPEGDDGRTPIYRIGLQFNRAVSRRIQGQFAVRYLKVMPQLGNPSYQGVGWQAHVDILPVPRLKFSLDGSQDVGSGYSLGSAYTISRTYLGRGQLSFSKSSAALSYSRTNYQYRGEDSFFVIQPRVRSTSNDVTLSYSYNLTTTKHLGGYVGYENRSDVNSYYNFSGERVGISLGGTF